MKQEVNNLIQQYKVAALIAAKANENASSAAEKVR
jgi:hypothetical protein